MMLGLSLPFFPSASSGTSWSLVDRAMATFGVIGVILLTVYLYLWPYRAWTSSFKNLPGPPATHWFWGNLKDIFNAEPMAMHSQWLKEYGSTLRYRVFMGSQRFFTADLKAISFVTSHSDIFIKPVRVRQNLTKTLGNGVLVAEGHDHRRQRRALNPSFSPAAIKRMYPIFYDKAYELRAKLLAVIEDDTIQAAPTPAKPEDVVPGAKKIDVMKYVNQATLDVIGIAGFDYDFQALSQPHNELAEAYRSMFKAAQAMNLLDLFAAFTPFAESIPTKRRRIINESRKTTRSIGMRLIEDKKKAINAAYADGFEKGTDIGADLLSILVKANMASDVKPELRMSDEEVLAQITTFMLAGNETSSTAMTWILYCLSLNPECQRKVREEVLAVQDERPSPEALANLSYLDGVIREGLRLLPPAPGTVREASENVTVPLGKPVRGRDGTMIDSIYLAKGSTLFVPIMPVNTMTDVWGPDAEDFNPDRYASLGPEAMKDVPGVWGGLMTFLGGARACIGYRFALAEMRAILFVLLRTFEFQELRSKPKIQKKSAIVMRPRVVGEEKEGLQMPLMVKPLSA